VSRPEGNAPDRATPERDTPAAPTGQARGPEGAGAPPPGYLGADARIRRGPAPELVEAGYELELADAPLLSRGLGLADLAHVVVLDAIPDADRRALLAALLELLDEEPAVDPRYGDLANLRERWLEQRIGTAAGWLNAGRPRREAGRTAFRIALRERVLELHSAVLRFATALVDAAARERDTPMPDYTYLQAAQPTTAGHWLLSFAYPALRDAARLRGDFDWVNRSPAGAGGVNGSRFAPDRARLAELLGFGEPIAHTRDAAWQTDGFVELASHAALAAVGASRFAEDVELYSSDEFGLLAIGDELCRASALMPQKRNPYALVVLRGGAGTLIGRATGVLATQRTPSGRTDNLLHTYGEVSGAVELAARLLRLAAAVAESLTVDRAAADRALRTSFAHATDLAEVVSRETGLDYRSAYRVVGRAVAEAAAQTGRTATDTPNPSDRSSAPRGARAVPEAGAPEDARGAKRLDAAALDAAARELLGRELGLDGALVAAAQDPEACLATRTTIGGAAAAPMDAMLADSRAALEDARVWCEAARAAAADAERALVERARKSS
jgi:argininosuccinate lyase